MKLGDFRKLTQSLPDETDICYYGYNKGCSLFPYQSDDVWLFPKDKPPVAVVMNPGSDWDGRAARKVNPS